MRGEILATLVVAGLGAPPAIAYARTAEPRTTAGASAAPITQRPQPLEGKSGCDLWKGTVSGNDPSVLVELLVCESIGGGVTGQLQWSSLKSGYSIREIAGEWSKDRQKLLIHDTALVVDKPNFGWKFCTVDLYDLALTSKTRLLGTYTASKCPDTATVDLSLVERPAPKVVIPEPEEEPNVGADRPDSDVRDPKPEEKSSCLCSTPGGASASSGPLSIGVAALLLLARFTRDRSRRRRGAAPGAPLARGRASR